MGSALIIAVSNSAMYLQTIKIMPTRITISGRGATFCFEIQAMTTRTKIVMLKYFQTLARFILRLRSGVDVCTKEAKYSNLQIIANPEDTIDEEYFKSINFLYLFGGFH